MPWRGLSIFGILALVFVGVVVVSIVVFGGRPLAIDYYRETAPNKIAIGVTSGERSWTLLTSVDEDANSVTVRADAWDWPIAGPDVGFPVEFIVTLEEPLAGRAVVNGRDGAEVVRTTCEPPLWDLLGCIER
jgi:hypothetical protein